MLTYRVFTPLRKQPVAEFFFAGDAVVYAAQQHGTVKIKQRGFVVLTLDTEAKKQAALDTLGDTCEEMNTRFYAAIRKRMARYAAYEANRPREQEPEMWW